MSEKKELSNATDVSDLENLENTILDLKAERTQKLLELNKIGSSLTNLYLIITLVIGIVFPLIFVVLMNVPLVERYLVEPVNVLAKQLNVSLESAYASVVIAFSALVAVAIVLVTYQYFWRPRIEKKNACRIQLAEKNDLLTEKEDELTNLLQETPQGRQEFLQRQLRHVTSDAARVFVDNAVRRRDANHWCKEAQAQLDQADEGNHVNESLSEAQFYIDSIEEMIVLEKAEKRAQGKWQLLALIIILFYIVIVVSPIISWNSGNWIDNFYDRVYEEDTVPMLLVPIQVLMWGAAGSLCTILYKYYTEKSRVRFWEEFRWLIARPITGIIMSAVVYLALVSGLILFSGASLEEGVNYNQLTYSQKALFSIAAFLAGFSDKFYDGIIDLLVGQGSLSRTPKQPGPTKDDLGSNKPSSQASSIMQI